MNFFPTRSNINFAVLGENLGWILFEDLILFENGILFEDRGTSAFFFCDEDFFAGLGK